MARGEATQLALALHQQPARNADCRRFPLPDDVTEVLRLAAGQSEAISAATRATGASEQTLREAARFFVEQQLLAREFDDDYWRILGVPPGAPEDLIREHRRLLVGLVHPDRSEDWEAAYSDRVNRAWRALKSAEGRESAMPSPGPEFGVQPAADDLTAPDLVDEDDWYQGPEGARPTAAGAMTPLVVDAAPEPPTRRPGSRIVALAGPLAVSIAAIGLVWVLASSEWTGDEVLVPMHEPEPEAVAAEPAESTMTADPMEIAAAPTEPTDTTLRPPIPTGPVSAPVPALTGEGPVSDTAASDLARSRAEAVAASSTRRAPSPDPMLVVAPPAAQPVRPVSVVERTTDDQPPATIAVASPTRATPMPSPTVATPTVASPSVASPTETATPPLRRPAASPAPEAIAVRPRPQPEQASTIAVAPTRGEPQRNAGSAASPAAAGVTAAAVPGPAPVAADQAPAADGRPVVASSTRPAAVSTQTLASAGTHRLLDAFSTHYASGNLSSLIALFSQRANSANGGTMALAADYARLFQSTREREITISQVAWRIEGDVLRGGAKFEARYHKQGRLFRQSVRGDIVFAMVVERGELRILRLDSLPEGERS